MQMKPPLEEISRKEVYHEKDGADFSVTEVQTIVRDTGERAQFNVVSVKNGTPGVVTIVRSADGYFLLGKHWRVSINQFAWEFPRGMGESGETAVQSALRELQEETGLRLDDYLRTPKFFQYIHPDSGLQSINVAVIEVVLRDNHNAYNNTLSHADWELGGNFQWLSPAELEESIRQGEITDGITLAAWSVWKACH